MCFSGKNTLIFLSPFPFLSAAIIAVPVLLLVGCCNCCDCCACANHCGDCCIHSAIDMYGGAVPVRGDAPVASPPIL